MYITQRLALIWFFFFHFRSSSISEIVTLIFIQLQFQLEVDISCYCWLDFGVNHRTRGITKLHFLESSDKYEIEESFGNVTTDYIFLVIKYLLLILFSNILFPSILILSAFFSFPFCNSLFSFYFLSIRCILFFISAILFFC